MADSTSRLRSCHDIFIGTDLTHFGFRHSLCFDAVDLHQQFSRHASSTDGNNAGGPGGLILLALAGMLLGVALRIRPFLYRALHLFSWV